MYKEDSLRIITTLAEEQRLIKSRDEWQKTAMKYEKAMNQNNARAQKAESELAATKRKLERLQMKLEDIVRTAMNNAIDLVLRGDTDEAQKGRED